MKLEEFEFQFGKDLKVSNIAMREEGSLNYYFIDPSIKFPHLLHFHEYVTSGVQYITLYVFLKPMFHSRSRDRHVSFFVLHAKKELPFHDPIDRLVCGSNGMFKEITDDVGYSANVEIDKDRFLYLLNIYNALAKAMSRVTIGESAIMEDLVSPYSYDYSSFIGKDIDVLYNQFTVGTIFTGKPSKKTKRTIKKLSSFSK